VQSSKKDLLNRLATIEGHIKGIKKMVEDDQYCVDVLKQSYAVERARSSRRRSWRVTSTAACRPGSRKAGTRR
jgi:DNA-binding FrmR family transcriptional regulator